MSEHSEKFRYSIRTALVTVSGLGAYLALARVYGFGRAVLCVLNLLLVLAGGVFLAAAWCTWKDEQPRNAVAAGTVAILILTGGLLVASFVFR